MRKLFLLVTLLAPTIAASAQTPDPIEDNSFLIEEAYNQEKGVIQYIHTFFRTRNGDWGYSFTNEYPIKVQQHQFSYTINVVRADGRVGIGDTYINYRYQIAGMKEGARVAAAPRFSVILPTGDFKKGRGAGAVGYQFNIPISVKVAKKLVTHWNAGVTVTPHARNKAGDKATTTAFNLGQSTIFLAKWNFNLMFETAWYRNQSVSSPGRTSNDYALLLNPGVRWAWNLKNGFQVVPGVAVPLGVGPSRGERGMYLYLSFEK
ncbi:MAG: transporter [Acidobacteria bacterium]|nr:transporter [Acidobacteriota bacterium]